VDKSPELMQRHARRRQSILSRLSHAPSIQVEIGPHVESLSSFQGLILPTDETLFNRRISASLSTDGEN